MACGVPVAAYPVTGPVDVIKPGINGALNEDLAKAVHAALQVDPASCRQYAVTRSWKAATEQFFNHLTPAHALQRTTEFSRAFCSFRASVFWFSSCRCCFCHDAMTPSLFCWSLSF